MSTVDLNFSHRRSYLSSEILLKENYYYALNIDEHSLFLRYQTLYYLKNLLSTCEEKIPVQDEIKFFTSFFDKPISDELYNTIYDKSKELDEEMESDPENRDWQSVTGKLHTYLKTQIKSFINIQLDILSIDDNTISKKIKNISDTFKLNLTEQKVLTYEYIYENHEVFSSFIDSNSAKQHYKTFSITSFKSVAKLLNIPVQDIGKAYSKIIKFNLFDDDTNIAPELSSSINGYSDEPLLQKYYNEYKNPVLPIEYFSFENNESDIIKSLLTNKSQTKGIKILFYGKPGTGKTEFARSILRNLEYTAYQLNQPEDNGKNKDISFRLRALNAYENSYDHETSCMIIDEADEFVSTRNNVFTSFNDNQKGKLNIFLDESITNQIWITNSVSGMDDSTMRRFDYCLYFPDLSKKQKIKVWENILNEYNIGTLCNDEILSELSGKYECNAGNIRNAICNYMRVDRTLKDTEIFQKIINASMQSYMKLKNPLKSGIQQENAITSKYSESILNIRGDIKDYISIIDNFNEQWKTGECEIKNMNILMYGPPGTGKTEFAKYISRHLGRKLIIKSPSDMLSKWVGGTEQNIAESFYTAESEDGILFIDETDSLLRSRDKAEHSWESTQVNELLMRMENFKGIFISATNRFETLDPAVIRRFNIKIEFDYLTIEGVINLFGIYFNDFSLDILSAETEQKLKKLTHLTPADFKVVHQKTFFMNKSSVNANLIVDMLSEECRLKEGFLTRKIGFC